MPEGWLVEMTIIFLGIVFFHHLPERFKVMFQASTSCDFHDLYVWFVFIPWRFGNIYMDCFKAGFCSLFHVLAISPMKCSIRSPWFESSSLVGKISPVISHYIHIYIYILLVLFDTDFCWWCFTVYLWVFLLPIVVSFILEILVSIPMIVIPFSHYICVYTNIFLHSKKHILLVYPMIFPYDIPIKPVYVFYISHDIPWWNRG